MSTPPGHDKELYKNCKWSNADEKRAFYNHYFKNSIFVNEAVKEKLDEYKKDLLSFIDAKKEKITIQDIIKEIKL